MVFFTSSITSLKHAPLIGVTTVGTILTVSLDATAQNFSAIEEQYLFEEGQAFCTLLAVRSSDPGFVVQTMARAAVDYEQTGLATDGVDLVLRLADSAVISLCPEQAHNWVRIQQYLSSSRPATSRVNQSSPNSTNAPFAVATLIGSPGGRINVREQPGINTPIRFYGYTGNRVTIWESRSVDNYTWYKVAFYGSNAVGWIREDLLQFDP